MMSIYKVSIFACTAMVNYCSAIHVASQSPGDVQAEQLLSVDDETAPRKSTDGVSGKIRKIFWVRHGESRMNKKSAPGPNPRWMGVNLFSRVQ